MSSGVQRRLDALIGLCSILLGIALTRLYFPTLDGSMFLLISLLPTVLIFFVSIWYGKNGSPNSTEQ
jgi:hypothetical protein